MFTIIVEMLLHLCLTVSTIYFYLQAEVPSGNERHIKWA